jgi:hypothetical protein
MAKEKKAKKGKKGKKPGRPNQHGWLLDEPQGPSLLVGAQRDLEGAARTAALGDRARPDSMATGQAPKRLHHGGVVTTLIALWRTWTDHQEAPRRPGATRPRSRRCHAGGCNP